MMGLRINHSWWTYQAISCSCQCSTTGVTKYVLSGMVHIKDPLLLIRKRWQQGCFVLLSVFLCHMSDAMWLNKTCWVLPSVVWWLMMGTNISWCELLNIVCMQYLGRMSHPMLFNMFLSKSKFKHAYRW